MRLESTVIVILAVILIYAIKYAIYSGALMVLLGVAYEEFGWLKPLGFWTCVVIIVALRIILALVRQPPGLRS